MGSNLKTESPTARTNRLAACRRYYATHKDQFLRNSKAWKAANPDRVKALSRAYSQRNVARLQTQRVANRAQKAAYDKRRRGFDREETRRKDREYYKQNAERLRCNAREYRRTHPDFVARSIARGQVWAAANVDRLKAYRIERQDREHELRIGRAYGLSRDAYLALLKKQEGKCAICFVDRPSPNGKRKRFFVDHDHCSLVVRGLLCLRCNLALGAFGDKISALKAALRYLQRRSTKIKYRENDRKTRWGLLALQQGKCGVCRQFPAKPHLDHNHSTGYCRGVLCDGCNIGMGGFVDDCVRIRSAIKYLYRSGRS